MTLSRVKMAGRKLVCIEAINVTYNRVKEWRNKGCMPPGCGLDVKHTDANHKTHKTLNLTTEFIGWLDIYITSSFHVWHITFRYTA